MAFRDNKPIYVQIADRIMDRIALGQLSEAERIPSVREYAASAGVNPNTVMRSYDWLQQSDIIYNRRGIGYFVAEGALHRVQEMRRADFFNNDIKDMFERLYTFEVSPDELSRLYLEYISSLSI